MAACSSQKIDIADLHNIQDEFGACSSGKHRSHYYAEVLSLRLPIFRTRAVTTHLLTLLFLRVLKPPLDGWPHGLVGCLLPFDLPRPPPCGWSSDVMSVAE